MVGIDPADGRTAQRLPKRLGIAGRDGEIARGLDHQYPPRPVLIRVLEGIDLANTRRRRRGRLRGGREPQQPGGETAAAQVGQVACSQNRDTSREARILPHRQMRHDRTQTHADDADATGVDAGLPAEPGDNGADVCDALLHRLDRAPRIRVQEMPRGSVSRGTPPRVVRERHQRTADPRPARNRANRFISVMRPSPSAASITTAGAGRLSSGCGR